ncbi:hypothetical protein B0H16DRAFT_1454247 [Mycena metata]|uniref:Major facilitator superfamily (MFS) profile domain-containing protein n=1 Tax=Mycena metata TaxID=1033252 RepID=A0AAD7JJA9_9AGAR|nr:hypothetical protein B0H16DRAFT_1454247 [Mycena metata]
MPHVGYGQPGDNELSKTLDSGTHEAQKQATSTGPTLAFSMNFCFTPPFCTLHRRPLGNDMATYPTETDPLLRNAPNAQPTESKVKLPVGPLEMSKSDRYAILAGIWMATFFGTFLTPRITGTEFDTSTDECDYSQSLHLPRVMPAISSEFQKFNQASWLGTAYLLATCTFTPLYGRLCIVMGRRGANQMALAFAALGTVGCGLSRNMETLILARFLAGIGGGGIYTTSTSDCICNLGPSANRSHEAS